MQPATYRAPALAERQRTRLDETLVGLRAYPKRLPARMVADTRAAELRELITGLDEYYPARTELQLLDTYMSGIASEVGISAHVLELGTSVAIRTRRLMRMLDRPASHIGVDTCSVALDYTARVLRRELPTLDVQWLIADYSLPFTVPSSRCPRGRTLVYVPGTTIDGFDPSEAVALLARMQRLVGATGRLLISADGTRDPDAVFHAYNDRDGLIAELAKRSLVPVGLPCDRFAYRALWNVHYSRVEIQLVSQHDQSVAIAGELVSFAAGEPIAIAHAYKHDVHTMRRLLLAAGWQPRSVFTADEQPMRLWLCEPIGDE